MFSGWKKKRGKKDSKSPGPPKKMGGPQIVFFLKHDPFRFKPGPVGKEVPFFKREWVILIMGVGLFELS